MRKLTLRSRHKVPLTTCLVVLVLTGLLIFPTLMSAQTYSVLYSFDAQGPSGYDPLATLTMDRAGNIYGTCSGGGLLQGGTVFKLSHSIEGWGLTPLASFGFGEAGSSPRAPVLLASDGLYSTTDSGGKQNYGVVFRLQVSATPPASLVPPWTETVAHYFGGPPTDGNYSQSGLIRDTAGNLYGTTWGGGTYDDGTVYELSRSNGIWVEKVLHSFAGTFQGDGYEPTSELIMDSAGNLYGTTSGGGAYNNYGTVFELSPTLDGWSYKVLHSFQYEEGTDVFGGVVMDSKGNLFGTSSVLGPNGGGTIWELSPNNGDWSLQVLYAMQGSIGSTTSGLAMDAAGSLYGTRYGYGTYGNGSIFKLSPVGEGWQYSELFGFPNENTDGAEPVGGVILDSAGNLYGTARYLGPEGGGVVWMLTQN